MSNGTIVNWRADGGISTKQAPLMVQPGSALLLDDVRQERLNEWRTRPGTNHDANDDLPGGNVPVLCTEAPWGGFVGLCRQADSATAGRVYTPSALPRWNSPLVTFNVSGSAQQCSQTSPGQWGRLPISPMGGMPSQSSMAEGGGYRLTAWWSNVAGAGIQVSLTTTAGMTILASSLFGNFTTAVRPKCVYSSAANRLILVWATSAGGVINTAQWDTTTGLQVGGVTALSTNGHVGSDLFLDAFYYGGATITIAFRDNVATGGLRIIEYNPTAVTSTEYTPGQDASNCLALLPDPDASGTRYVAVCSAVPEVRVVRLNAVGVIQTNELAEAVLARNFAGCAYQSTTGTPGWMLVYSTTANPRLRAVKRRNGATSAVANISPAAFTVNHSLATNAWREPGTDAMRYVMYIAEAVGPNFVQSSFYEMALEFENGVATVSNKWTEPQARILPLNAGAGFEEFASMAQVQRTGTDRFVLPLARIASFDDIAGTNAYRYAIDAWSVQYLNATTYTNQNHGQGTKTQQCAYLPAGSLLQTATGQLLCSLGASALPFSPTATPSNGAGNLTPGAAYQHVITTDLYDEEGNVWSSDPCLVSAKVSTAAMAGNNQITVVAQNTPFENGARLRTVKFWRTKGNGAAFFLVHEVTDTIANTVSISWLDTIADTALAEAISAELQGTVLSALSHVVFWNQRLWGVDRDFPSLIRFSKPIASGFSPIFPADFVVDISDEFGSVTGLAALDDKITALKAQAAYAAGGDGPGNDGSGASPVFNRFSSETGSIVGAPVLSTGSELYVVSSGGVFRARRSQEFDFVGAAIDLFLSMPLLKSEETVIGMVLSASKNEVRVQTTNYRFVHDRIFNVWERDTGGMSSGIAFTRMLNGKQALFLANGQMWVEANDSNTPADAGVAFAGKVRSPWMRPANMEGWINLRHLRALGECTTAGTVAQPTISIFFDNDDTIIETFQPRVQIAAQVGPMRADCKPRKQLCTAFSAQLTLPAGDATIRFDSWSALVAIEPEMQGLTGADNWLAGVTAAAKPCPDCPAIPAPSPVPLVLKTWITSKQQNALLGGGAPNKFDLLVKVKDALKASGQWIVVSSCDGVTVSASDLWTNWTKLKGFPDGVFSFIILKNVAFGFEIMINVTQNIADTEIDLSYSASGAFVGGTTTVTPTAVDGLSNSVTSWIGRRTADDQYYALTSVASDGSGTRIDWFFAGKWLSLWQFDVLYTAGVVNTAEWTTPFMAAARNGISDPTTDFAVLSQNKFAFSGVGFGDFTKLAWIPSPGNPQGQTLLHGSQELVKDDSSVAFYPPDLGHPWSTRHLWTSPLGMLAFNGGSPTQGFCGYLQDQWWTTSGFNDGDTIAGGKYIIIGESIRPWDGTLAPPIGATVPSVDYPASLFYGRSTL